MPTPGEAEDGRRLAVIVATSTYSDATLQQLRAPGHDAEAFAEVLQDPELGDFTVLTLVNESSERIKRRIAEFCAEGGPADVALLYFSCHGLVDDRGRLYYATVDTERRWLSVTAIPAQWLNEQLDDCQCRRQLLLLDCCHSGAFAKGAKGDAALALKGRFDGRGRVVMTASRATEYSFEGDRVVGTSSPSYFTEAIIDGIRSGKADVDRDGLITVPELYDYAFAHVKQRESRQTPGIWMNAAEGRFLVARSPLGAVLDPAPLPEHLRFAIESASRNIRQAAVQDIAQILTGPNLAVALTARATLQHVAEEDAPAVAAAARAALAEHDQSVAQETARREAEEAAAREAEETARREAEEAAAREAEETARREAEEAARSTSGPPRAAGSPAAEPVAGGAPPPAPVREPAAEAREPASPVPTAPPAERATAPEPATAPDAASRPSSARAPRLVRPFRALIAPRNGWAIVSAAVVFTTVAAFAGAKLARLLLAGGDDRTLRDAVYTAMRIVPAMVVLALVLVLARRSRWGALRTALAAAAIGTVVIGVATFIDWGTDHAALAALWAIRGAAVGLCALLASGSWRAIAAAVGSCAVAGAVWGLVAPDLQDAGMTVIILVRTVLPLALLAAVAGVVMTRVPVREAAMPAAPSQGAPIESNDAPEVGGFVRRRFGRRARAGERRGGQVEA